MEKQKTKLTNDDIQCYLDASKVFNDKKQKIVDRIDEVLHLVAATFGAEINYWYFENAEEGEVGYFHDCDLDMEHGCFYLNIKYVGHYVSMQTEKTDYAYLPTYLLLMTNEEIRNQIKEEQAEEKAKKEKQKKRKQKQVAAKKKALAKLSAADKKALGLK